MNPSEKRIKENFFNVHTPKLLENQNLEDKSHIKHINFDFYDIYEEPFLILIFLLIIIDQFFPTLGRFIMIFMSIPDGERSIENNS